MIKKTFHLSALAMLLFLGSASFTSCKDKAKTDENTTTTVPVQPEVVPAAPSAPVVISADDSLRQNLTDATKDFPNVKATVNEGVVTLTGDIQRSSLKTLMQSINSLHPKKIENQLTIK